MNGIILTKNVERDRKNAKSPLSVSFFQFFGAKPLTNPRIFDIIICTEIRDWNFRTFNPTKIPLKFGFDHITDHNENSIKTYTPCEHHRICGGTMCFFVNDEGSRSNHRIRSCEQAPRCEFSRLSRRSEGGIAPVSGLNHRSLRCKFLKR